MMSIWIMNLKDNRDVGRISHYLKHRICMHLSIVAMGWYCCNSAEAKHAEERLNSLKRGDIVWISNPGRNGYTIAVIEDDAITKEYSDLHEADINLARHIRILTSVSKILVKDKCFPTPASRRFLQKTEREDIRKLTRDILSGLDISFL